MFLMLKYSLEYRLSLSESPTIYALTFAEVGNVWKDFSSSIKEFTSEDVGICQLLREKNLKIYINKKIKVGHEKSWILK